MTTLIAGCGDLGLIVAKRLMGHNTSVMGLRRHPAASNPAKNELFQWLAADLLNTDSLFSLSNLAQDITQVVYCVTPDQRTPEQYRATYVQGLQNLTAALGSDDLGSDNLRFVNSGSVVLSAAELSLVAPGKLSSVASTKEAQSKRNIRRWVFVSSTAVYGASSDEWVDENTPTLPDGFNGKILLEAEQFLHHHHQNSVAMRLSGIYGPGRNQIVQRIQQGLATAPIEPPHYSNRIHIDDAARAIEHVLSLSNPDSVYVVTDLLPLPMHTLYNHIAEQLGAPPVPIGPPPAGMSSKRLSSKRLVDSGFTHLWPNARIGYDAMLKG
jgi:nucleoside-diphosphate-sugar epimerase